MLLDPGSDCFEFGLANDDALAQKTFGRGNTDGEAVAVHVQKDRCERKRDTFVSIDERVVLRKTLHESRGLERQAFIVPGAWTRQSAFDKPEVAQRFRRETPW